MSNQADRIRLCLGNGPTRTRQLVDTLGISQPTVSRMIASLGDEIVRIGVGRSIQYALRDSARGLGDIPVYRVSTDGTLGRLGVLVPVRPEGFVMQQDDGQVLHSDGLPWWLIDMRPQSFLGRVYAERHAGALGLPAHLSEWTDAHALRALLTHGDDVVGNLLLGDIARAHFINAPAPVPVTPEHYPALAEAAERGDLPGSSAGGEQPKFVAFTDRHVLVKFTATDDNAISRRWRDLLAAEHVAAQALGDAGLPVARSRLIDVAGRRFLEVERFDRVGQFGRRGLHSLASVEAEFIGEANSPWPVLAAKLAARGIITGAAATSVALLYAFGTLIGNTDMHHGNLSFINETGRPYELAPAYDMLPMAFAPRHSGEIANRLPPLQIHPSIPPETWRQALSLAKAFVCGLTNASRAFSEQWAPCVTALIQHIEDAASKIGRLA